MTTDSSPSALPEIAVPWTTFRHVVRESTEAGAPLWIVATGRSMQPRIRDGDRVLVDVRPARPRPGMVLLVDRDGAPVMHRVSRCDDATVVLRADTLERDDPPVPLSAIVGRAVAVSRRGRITPLAATLHFGAAASLRYAVTEIAAARLSLRRRMRRALVGTR